MRGVAGVAVLALLSLTGCEAKGKFGANCYAIPGGFANPRGTIAAVIDAPLKVKPGAVFNLTVKSFGSQDAQTDNPASARAGVVNITGPATADFIQPNGDVSFGTLSSPAVYPVTIRVTVTGQPGEKIDISAGAGGQLVGVPPLAYAILCTPDQPSKLTTIPIEAS
jgi:hypothetical protein